MAVELKLRRGTTQQHEVFTGAEAEVTVDTDTNSLVVHDGNTPGGNRALMNGDSDAPPRTVATIAELRALRATNRPVQVLGYYKAGDGGGGPLRVYKTGATPGTYIDNGGSVVVPEGGDGSAAWIFATAKKVRAEEFGADPTGVIPSGQRVRAALGALPDGATLEFKPGTYDMSDSPNVTLAGNNKALVCAGFAVFDFGGGLGFRFAEEDQRGWHLEGLEVVNSRIGIGRDVSGSPATGNSLKEDFTFKRIRIRDYSGPGIAKGIELENRVRNILLDDVSVQK